MNKYFTAIDILTGLRVRPFINEAFSNREYKCGDEKCSNKVVFCAEKSEKVTPYFRHIKTDNICTRYSYANEKTIHDEAIRILKMIISENSNAIIIKQKCNYYVKCEFVEECEFEKFDEITDELIIESKYDESKHRADLVWFSNKIPYIIFEVKYTHKTTEEARENYTWYELNAEEILKCEKNNNNQYILHCLRRKQKIKTACDECIEKYEKNKKQIEEKLLKEQLFECQRLQKLESERLQKEQQLEKLKNERLQKLESERLQKEQQLEKLKNERLQKLEHEIEIKELYERMYGGFDIDNQDELNQNKLYYYRGSYYSKPAIYSTLY